MSRTLALLIAALIVAALVCGCATTPPPRPGALTDEDYDNCDRVGGCVLIGKSKLIELLQHIRDRALAACRDET